MNRITLSVVLSAAVAFTGSTVAHGFIMQLFSLKEVVDQSTNVLVGRIKKVDVRRKTAEATLTKALKGKLEYTTVKMNISTGAAGHPQYLLKHLKPGAEVILFYKREGKSIACCGHSDGTWFQLFASDNPKARNKVWWNFSHIEIYLPRTYDGNTPGLIRIADDVAAGRSKGPKPNPRVAKINITKTSARAATAAGRPSRKTVSPPAKVAMPKGGFHRQAAFTRNGGSEVRGLSFVDVNGDERLDVLLNRQAGNLLLVNQGDGWKDKARDFGLAHGVRSAAWCDYNGDDHPDVVTSRFQLLSSVAGKLRDDSKLLAAPSARNPEGGGWIDANGDGLPDILMTNGEHGIRLWQNTGKGPDWFRDVSDAAGLGRKGLGAGNGDFVTCFDYDGDGYTDFLYNLGDGLLVHNEGNGTFKVAAKSGLRLANGGSYKRGVAVADFDNDDDLDLFVPAPKRPALYRNNGDGTFTDVYRDSGDLTAEEDPCFAAAWGDVNCDGALDLFVCHTHGSSRLYLGDGRGRFRDVSGAAGVRKLSPAYAAGFADLDGDGDLDLAINLADRVVVATNEFARPKDRAPLVVRVQARRGQVGAVIRVNNAEGKFVGMHELRGADGCGGQAAPLGHFGLPRGRHLVTVCLSDGRAAQKTINMTRKAATLSFRENEFE